MNTSGLDPKNIKIYGNGGKLLPQLNSEFRYDDLQENSIFVAGEGDGNFDENDYIKEEVHRRLQENQTLKIFMSSSRPHQNLVLLCLVEISFLYQLLNF